MKKKIIATLLALVLVSSLAAVAQGANGTSNVPNDRMPKFICLGDKLNLTDEQVGKIQRILSENASKVRELQLQMMQKREELQQLRWQKGVDAEKAKALWDELKNLRTQLMEQKKNTHNAILSVLTDEQKNKLKEICPRGCGMGPGKGPGAKKGHMPGFGSRTKAQNNNGQS